MTLEAAAEENEAQSGDLAESLADEERRRQELEDPLAKLRAELEAKMKELADKLKKMTEAYEKSQKDLEKSQKDLRNAQKEIEEKNALIEAEKKNAADALAAMKAKH